MNWAANSICQYCSPHISLTVCFTATDSLLEMLLHESVGAQWGNWFSKKKNSRAQSYMSAPFYQHRTNKASVVPRADKYQQRKLLPFCDTNFPTSGRALFYCVTCRPNLRTWPVQQRVGGMQRGREKKGGALLLLAHRFAPEGRGKQWGRLKRINIMFPHNCIYTRARAALCSNSRLDLGEHMLTLRIVILRTHALKLNTLTIVGASTSCGFGPFICADKQFSHKVEKIPSDSQTLSHGQTKPPATTFPVSDL